MLTLSKEVLAHAAGLTEGLPLVAKELLHLGNRAAVDQVLSRLVQRGSLLRAGRGVYVRPVESRFGVRAPSTAALVEGLAKQRGETIALHGAAAANALGKRGPGLYFLPSSMLFVLLSVQALKFASSLSTTSRAVTIAMPRWVPIGSRCLRSSVTINSARATTAAAIT
jgi:hypothetical protein